MVSGSVCDISLADWKSNTRYAGGYTGMDPYIQQFWAVVESFSEGEKSLLLRFVTSVPRPPSLGFSALNPPFTIQRVDVDSDARLPTASTCFNILKLPRYSGKSVLREKLLLAINSRSGFDLS
jgi:ubiquitin-protein ligase E3 C